MTERAPARLAAPQIATFCEVNIPTFFPVSVLRTFRIVRVLKLARSFESLRVILVTLTKSVVSVTYLFILMLLFILIVCDATSNPPAGPRRSPRPDALRATVRAARHGVLRRALPAPRV